MVSSQALIGQADPAAYEKAILPICAAVARQTRAATIRERFLRTATSGPKQGIHGHGWVCSVLEVLYGSTEEGCQRIVEEVSQIQKRRVQKQISRALRPAGAHSGGSAIPQAARSNRLRRDLQRRL